MVYLYANLGVHITLSLGSLKALQPLIFNPWLFSSFFYTCNSHWGFSFYFKKTFYPSDYKLLESKSILSIRNVFNDISHAKSC